jgi:hypothetical protein
MTVEGTIYDINGNEVSGATIYIAENATGRQLSPGTTLDGPWYKAWIETGKSPYEYAVAFTKPGYEPTMIQFYTLLEINSDVTMSKKPINQMMIAVAALAVIAFVMANRKSGKSRHVGAITMSEVLPWIAIAAGVLGFDLIKKVLEMLGIWDSRNTKELDAEATSANSPWRPNYWQQFQTYTYAFTESQMRPIAVEIKNALGWIDDCEECIKAQIYKMKTKANLSFLAWVFEKLYNKDLFDTLRGGWWPKDGISDSDLNELVKYVNGLPAN